MDILPLTKWFVIIAVVYVILVQGMYHFSYEVLLKAY